MHGIGGAGLRASDWISGQGRLLWSNDGPAFSAGVLVTQPRVTATGPDGRARAVPIGHEHYQHHVLDNLVRHGQQPEEVPIHCDFNAGFETLQLLESALNACR